MIPKSLQIPLRKYEGEFGVFDALHVRVEFNKNEYYLDDMIIGRVTAFLVKINIKKVQLLILKTESYLSHSKGKSMIKSKTDVVHKEDLKIGGLVKGKVS